MGQLSPPLNHNRQLLAQVITYILLIYVLTSILGDSCVHDNFSILFCSFYLRIHILCLPGLLQDIRKLVEENLNQLNYSMGRAWAGLSVDWTSAEMGGDGDRRPPLRQRSAGDRWGRKE